MPDLVGLTVVWASPLCSGRPPGQQLDLDAAGPTERPLEERLKVTTGSVDGETIKLIRRSTANRLVPGPMAATSVPPQAVWQHRISPALPAVHLVESRLGAMGSQGSPHFPKPVR